MLEDDDHETIPAPVHESVSMHVQDLGFEIQILTIDIEVPSKEMSPLQESRKRSEPSMLHHGNNRLVKSRIVSIDKVKQRICQVDCRASR